LRLLDRLGVYKLLLERAAVYTKTLAYSSRGRVLGEFDIGSWSEEKTGYSFMRVRRSDLQDVLLDAVREEGIQVRYSRQVVRIEEKDDGGIAATFSDGAIETADLLLGCDGIHSTVRSLYVDPEATPEYSGISAIYSFLPESDLPSTTSSTAFSRSAPVLHRRQKFCFGYSPTRSPFQPLETPATDGKSTGD
jgi:2-polyprenyl-6-methoxyphenol hydroxylase-like FAD-dependent oxidoreductase